MEEVIELLLDQQFAELKDRLKRCTIQAEQRAILDLIESKRLNEFMSWLQTDAACSSAAYMTVTGILLRRDLG